MGEILVSMGILPSRISDAAAFADKLNDPFLKAYIAAVPTAVPFPVVLGGQEFSESLQQHVEAVRVRQGDRGERRGGRAGRRGRPFSRRRRNRTRSGVPTRPGAWPTEARNASAAGGGDVTFARRARADAGEAAHERARVAAAARVMLSPAVSLLGVFVFAPMALTIWLAFQDWSTETGFGEARFVGLDNFLEIFGSTSVGRDFKGALFNTAVYTLASVAVILPLSIALGLLVYQRRVKGGVTLRTILFSTYMAPMIAVALVWSKLYSPTGRSDQPDSRLDRPAAGTMAVLAGYGARLDRRSSMSGSRSAISRCSRSRASRRSRRRSTRRRGSTAPVRCSASSIVTLPLLRRTLLFSAVIAVINAVQVFEPVALITQGGPVGSTNVLTYHIRRVGIERSQGGLGSAMAVTLMLALIVAIVALFALARRGWEDAA